MYDCAYIYNFDTLRIPLSLFLLPGPGGPSEESREAHQQEADCAGTEPLATQGWKKQPWMLGICWKKWWFDMV